MQSIFSNPDSDDFGDIVNDGNSPDLESCFNEYYNSHRELFSNLKSDTGRGKSFSCFATSVILHSVFKKQKLGDITFYWTDNTGDGKIDGIAFSINGKIISHAGQFERITEPINKIELYFIQSKKHRNAAFSQEEFDEFTQGVATFVAGQGVEDPHPSPSMIQWKTLWNSIRRKLSKLQINNRPKVNIYFYIATWSQRPSHNPFSKEERIITRRFQNYADISNVKFFQIDGASLAKHYTKYKTATKNPVLHPPTIVRPDYSQTAQIMWDRGIIKKVIVDENNYIKYGFISSCNNGDVYFNSSNCMNETYPEGKEVKFQFVKNPDLTSRNRWAVFGKMETIA